VESLPMMKMLASVDLNECNVKFVNLEWETIYNHSIAEDEERKSGN
jgi:hypothetical protein